MGMIPREGRGAGLLWIELIARHPVFVRFAAEVIGQSWRVGRACPQRAAAHRQSQPGALRTVAPYLPLSLRHYLPRACLVDELSQADYRAASNLHRADIMKLRHESLRERNNGRG